MTQQIQTEVKLITASRFAKSFGFSLAIIFVISIYYDGIESTLDFMSEEPDGMLAMSIVLSALVAVISWICQLALRLRNYPAYIAFKEKRKQEKLEKQEAEQAILHAIKKIPAHKKVERVIALDDDNSIIYVKPSVSENWMQVDYKDLVSWQEKWDNVGRTQEALIGQKTVFTEKNNVINLTVRGPQGPTIEVHLSNAEWRSKVAALLNANFS